MTKTTNPVVPWVDYFHQFKLVQEYQSILAVSGLKRFKYSLQDDWVRLDVEMVRYAAFLDKIAPAHRQQVESVIAECLETTLPADLLFDATFGHATEPSAYRLRMHAPDGVVLGVFQLAYNGLAIGDSPTPEHLTHLSAQATEMPSVQLAAVVPGDSLVAADTGTRTVALPDSTVDPLAHLFSPHASAVPAHRTPLPATTLGASGRNLVLHYQPQASIESREITGIEAFLRKWDPQKGLLGPDKFLAGMEASGELQAVTEWLVTSSLTHLVDCQDHARRPLRLTLNLAPSQLVDALFIEHLTELVAKHAPGLNDCIALDIPIPLLGLTYQQADWERLMGLMELMREKGFSPILEGYGYPDLSLPAKTRTQLGTRAAEVKINVGHFRGLDFNNQVGTIVREIAPWSLTLAAHGVEDADTLTSLKFMKVQTYQGNLLAAPMAIETLREFLVVWSSRSLL